MYYDRIKYLLSLIITVTLAGCETDADLVDLPEFKQKLVITAFLSPSNNTSSVNVFSNKKIYGELNTENPIDGLKGFISDGTDEITLDTIKTGFYINHSKMLIQYGKTYDIRVSNDKGLSIKATCTVPEKKNFSLKIDTLSSIVQYPDIKGSYRILEFKVSFLDPPGEHNYYRAIGKCTAYHTSVNSGKTYQWINNTRFEKEFFSDNGMDGKEIVLRTLNNNGNYLIGDSSFYVFYLFNTEKSYYLYHTSLDNYNNDENPFAEVTPVFSNITDGLGVFTSYTSDSVRIKLR
jgi:hypothetical protein